MTEKQKMIEAFEQLKKTIYKIGDLYSDNMISGDTEICDIISEYFPDELAELGFDDLADMLLDWAEYSIRELEK